MKFQQYLALFEEILHSENPEAPYSDAHFMNYTKLNWSRMNRWFKTGGLLPEAKAKIEAIDQPQKWILITEPWCGDAAHIVPFIKMLADLNPLIELELELRDQEPFRINDYLTNGGKAIPKLIIQDASAKDLAVWGPRPKEAQELYASLKASEADFETVKITLQNWYNEHKGVEIQEELMRLF